MDRWLVTMWRDMSRGRKSGNWKMTFAGLKLNSFGEVTKKIEGLLDFGASARDVVAKRYPRGWLQKARETKQRLRMQVCDHSDRVVICEHVGAIGLVSSAPSETELGSEARNRQGRRASRIRSRPKGSHSGGCRDTA